VAEFTATPVHRRKYHAFLSHAHADKASVDAIHSWLTDVAGIPVWYDATHLSPSASIVTALEEGISQSRTVMLVLSDASVRSGWVQEEYSAAMAQRAAHRDFRIVPIRLGDVGVPGFLQTTKWVDVSDGGLAISQADDLLASLYGEDTVIEPGTARDLYVSRTWRDAEAGIADFVCRAVADLGFRLIGDSKDQDGFDEGERIRSMIASCGAFMAVLPDRGGGETSGYMLREIEQASSLGLPMLIVAEPGVRLNEPLDQAAVRISPELSDGELATLQRRAQNLDEEWERPQAPHRVFFSTILDPGSGQRNRCIRRALERVTAMPCLIGDNIREGQIQRVIVDAIRSAFLVVADVSEGNLNTCIEAGVALGAERRLHLVAAGPRRRPAFMFRDHQVWYYDDEVDLLGLAHRIGHPYRRRILNGELVHGSRGSSRCHIMTQCLTLARN
jgi:hypothetical protein